MMAMIQAPVVSSGVVIPAQATSDAGMIDLWLASFRSPHTRRAYAADAAAFMQICMMPLCRVTVRDVQAFGASLSDGAVNSGVRRLSAVKSLITMGHRIGYLPFDVGRPVMMPAVKDTLAERILSEWQVQRLLELETDPRNGALLRLTYGAGLRISEVRGLLWKDLVARDDAGQITVFGKGGKTRVVLLPAGLWRRIIAIRFGDDLEAPVFRSRVGGCLDASQVHRIFKAAAKRAGLPAAASAHWLRHAHVSHALDRGAPVHVVRQTVGHASLETTTRYTHARPDDSSARYLAG
jgi:integrase/recombinase XerD